MSRPFEVGDLVVIHLFGFLKEGETFVDVSKIDCFMRNGDMRCCLDNRESTPIYKVNPSVSFCIKTIRKPRPGNAESREIVAISAKNAKNETNFFCRKFYEIGFWKEPAKKAWELYQKQRSLLK